MAPVPGAICPLAPATCPANRRLGDFVAELGSVTAQAWLRVVSDPSPVWQHQRPMPEHGAHHPWRAVYARPTVSGPAMKSVEFSIHVQPPLETHPFGAPSPAPMRAKPLRASPSAPEHARCG